MEGAAAPPANPDRTVADICVSVGLPQRRVVHDELRRSKVRCRRPGGAKGSHASCGSGIARLQVFGRQAFQTWKRLGTFGP
jgi:hypothetical protein